ncbi:MAG: helix-turn-helix transcriptional regulator [Alphaproteobacteria bacterium]|nr:helix-turn-helix transcriptional regulator [Alphaproteobacteria bacterium]
MAHKKKCNPAADTPCPLRELLTRLGDKWSILIIHALARAPQNRARFSELRREINGISQRMLTATLRNLERDGMLTREVYPVIPPRVDYTLTTLGKDLLHPVQALVAWVEGNWGKIEQARARFDAANGKSDKIA